jgi:fumarate reductase iron-sulfur subunit
MAEEKIVLQVLRYRPEQNASPYFQDYEVPYHRDWVVLDALNWIKDYRDGTLSFRWSCRMGVCGSCGMMVNGRPRLTCSTFLREFYPQPIRVEPLANFEIERDLVITMDPFLEKLKKVKPWIIRRDEKPIEEGEYKQTPAQLYRYKHFSMCINCMLCYAACPVVGLHPEFLGPAALALVMRYNLDSRDQGWDERMDAIATHEGLWSCTFVGECSEVCPKDVDPAAAIQQGKLYATLDWFQQWLMPWGKR